MGLRRLARERAVQFLFHCDLNYPEDLDAALNRFWAEHGGAVEEGGEVRGASAAVQEAPGTAVDLAAVRVFAEGLIRGTLAHRDAIDATICRHAKNWSLRRIAAVDRNVLRLAIYEMQHREDIPPVVSINEAVDIAKKFSTEDSGGFVNGILDKVKGELLRPARVIS
jgi:N utilization substance protein B